MPPFLFDNPTFSDKFTSMKLTKDQFTEFGTRVQAMLRATRWRCGQAMFNVLTDMNLSLAEEVRGTELDPFYDNERIGAFMKHILEPEQYNTLNPLFKKKCDRPSERSENPLVVGFAKDLDLSTNIR
jgi:hypothetical protein